MKTKHPLAVLLGLAAVALLAADASAIYHPTMGRFLQRDPGARGPMRPGRGFIPRDQYADGMNLYQYVRSRPVTAVDPNGTLTLVHKVGFDSEKKLHPWYFNITFSITAVLDESSMWWFGLPNKSDYYALGQDITIGLECWDTPQTDPENLPPPSSSGTLKITEVLALYYDLTDSFSEGLGRAYNMTDHHQLGIRRSIQRDNTKDCMCVQEIQVRSYIVAFDGVDYDDLPFGWHGGFLTSVEKTGLYADKPDSEIDGQLSRSPSTKLREVAGSPYHWQYEALYYPNAMPRKDVQLRKPWAIHSWPY